MKRLILADVLLELRRKNVLLICSSQVARALDPLAMMIQQGAVSCGSLVTACCRPHVFNRAAYPRSSWTVVAEEDRLNATSYADAIMISPAACELEAIKLS